ncbi:MAG: hypothetical protein R3Y04_08830, partial [Rikenellaceae bacterium]
YSIQRSEGEFYLSFLSEKIFYLILCNFPIPQLHLQVEFRLDNAKILDNCTSGYTIVLFVNDTI